MAAGLNFQVLSIGSSIFRNIMYNKDTWRKCHVAGFLPIFLMIISLIINEVAS